jgi:hypothetical protein
MTLVLTIENNHVDVLSILIKHLGTTFRKSSRSSFFFTIVVDLPPKKPPFFFNFLSLKNMLAVTGKSQMKLT